MLLRPTRLSPRPSSPPSPRLRRLKCGPARRPSLGSASAPRPTLSLVGSPQRSPTPLSRPSSPSPSTALRPPTRLRPLDPDPGSTRPTPSLGGPGVGAAEDVGGGGDAMMVLGALRTRFRLPLLLLALEVRPGHPSTPHGQGASRCGRFRVRGTPRPQLQPAAMLAAVAPLFALSWTPPAPPSQQPTWPGGWDQATLAQSFSAMGRTPPVSTEWIADLGASFHTTPDAGILSSV